MQNFDLIQNLTKAFDNSTYHNSEELFKKIVDLASQKLLNPNAQNGKIQYTIEKTRKISRLATKRKAKKIKKKALTQQKLKQRAIRKISSQNKKIHQLYHLKKIHLQSLKINKKEPMILRYYSKGLNEENQQEKQQSSFSWQVYPNDRQKSQLQNLPIQISQKSCTISQDKCPKKAVEDKFKKTRQNFHSYLQQKSNSSKIEEITCPICIQTLIDPVSTICGHCFCFSCLDESLLSLPTCPVCRLHIKGMQLVPCHQLKNLIRVKYDQKILTQQEAETYSLRKKQNHEWRQKRFVKIESIKEGTELDVRDTQHIWCQAVVLKVYSIDGKISSVLVHYLHWAKLYNQIIEVRSCRLAPRGHFTSRNDLPRYNLYQQRQNLRGTVVNGNPNLQPEPIRRENAVPMRQFHGIHDAISVLRNNMNQQLNQGISIPPLRMSSFFDGRNSRSIFQNFFFIGDDQGISLNDPDEQSNLSYSESQQMNSVGFQIIEESSPDQGVEIQLSQSQLMGGPEHSERNPFQQNQLLSQYEQSSFGQQQNNPAQNNNRNSRQTDDGWVVFRSGISAMEDSYNDDYANQQWGHNHHPQSEDRQSHSQ